MWKLTPIDITKCVNIHQLGFTNIIIFDAEFWNYTKNILPLPSSDFIPETRDPNKFYFLREVAAFDINDEKVN